MRHTAFIVCLALTCGACGATPSSGELPGNVSWVRNFLGADSRLLRVALDDADRVSMALLLRGPLELCGQRLGVGDPEQTTLAALRLAADAQCPLEWARTFQGDWQSMQDESVFGPARIGLAPVGNGDLLLSAGGLLGNYELDAGPLTFTEPGGMLLRIDGTDGSITWTRVLTDPNAVLEPRDVAVDGGNAYLLANRIDATLPDEPVLELWLAQVDPADGQTRWQVAVPALPDPADGDAAVLASRVAATAGAVSFSGMVVGSLDFGPEDPDFQNETTSTVATVLDDETVPARFVARFDASDGAPRWARTFDDGRFGEIQLTHGSDGELILHGNFQPPGEWRDVSSEEQPSLDDGVISVARLQPDGEPDWVRSWRSDWGMIEAASVDVDIDGNIAMSGTFDGSWAFATRPLISFSGPALYVAKVARDGRERWARFSAFTGPVLAADVHATSNGGVLGSGLFVPPELVDSPDFVEPSEPFLLMLAP